MILNSAPQNEAILSNVGAIGEFRIRNSAKAFSILSSGLYANKVRAIIRELSCNAVDSHVEAGKADTPFDVHLPNTLEPWFSIRDYGTGLTHDQVTQIYTTYFESTKTGSNSFIGALGLGSKSPFAYTDNFTVTAIRDGRRGIYSAFINNEGVPSIALMMEEQSSDPAGVEVKFSVNDRYDFDKFRKEARAVYTYFKLRPVVAGYADFTFQDVTYSDKDIIPGVDVLSGSHRQSSIAVMGNIAYPIDVPSSDATLGQLRPLLDCGLVIHFGIGELDFQASREGLSYIPLTMESIKRKLEALTAQLSIHLAAEANKIDNLWKRAIFLIGKSGSTLWLPAVTKYVTDTKFSLINCTSQYAARGQTFKFDVGALEKDYNLKISGFQKSRGSLNGSLLKPYVDYVQRTSTIRDHQWEIQVSDSVFFVVSDTKAGAMARARYHWRNAPRSSHHSDTVYLLEAADKKKPMASDAFLQKLSGPHNIQKVSALLQKPRAATERESNVTILRLERRDDNNGRYRRHANAGDMVWRDAGKSADFDQKATYYYLPLSGFNVISTYGVCDTKKLHTHLGLCGIRKLAGITVHGVRKGDLELIRKKKNWINLEDHIAATLKAVTAEEVMSLAAAAINRYKYVEHDPKILKEVGQDSPYRAVVEKFKDVKPSTYNRSALIQLCSRYTPGSCIDPEKIGQAMSEECQVIYKRYPLMGSLAGYSDDSTALGQYIRLIDKDLAEANVGK